MNRILVTGNAGSGKSTLARQIADRLDLPCFSLDRVVWQSGWKKTPQDEKARLIRDLIQPDRWVIDGVSSEVQAAADTVIFLDVERKVSFWRVSKRNCRYLCRSRPGLPAGCPEIMIIPTLFKIIWNFPKRIRPRILAQCEQAGAAQKLFHLRTNVAVEKFLSLKLIKSGGEETLKQMDQNFETYECSQCKSVWIAPSRSEIKWWTELAESIGGLVPQVGALRWLEKNSSADGWTRKTIVGHLCVIEDRCVNCGGRLRGKGTVKCPSCHATVINYVRGDRTRIR